METIRPAGPHDEDEVFRLIGELEGKAPDRQRFGEVYQQNLADPRVRYWVAEEDGRLLAFLSTHRQCLLHHTGLVAEIEEFIVEPPARGRGIGTRLFETAARDCRTNGCLQLEVCCNLKRLTSHAFYRARGMRSSHYKFFLPL